MRKTLAALGAFVALTGCSEIPSPEAQQQARRQMAMQAIAQAEMGCQARGMTPGATDYNTCVEAVSRVLFNAADERYAAHVQSIQASENARWAAAGIILAGGVNAYAASQQYQPVYTPPATVTTRCVPAGIGVRCTSY